MIETSLLLLLAHFWILSIAVKCTSFKREVVKDLRQTGSRHEWPTNVQCVGSRSSVIRYVRWQILVTEYIHLSLFFFFFFFFCSLIGIKSCIGLVMDLRKCFTLLFLQLIFLFTFFSQLIFCKVGQIIISYKASTSPYYLL